MKSAYRKVILTAFAALAFALVGCGTGNNTNGGPVSQAPAADPDAPPPKDAKGKPAPLPR
jgi:hypothetical protein